MTDHLVCNHSVCTVTYWPGAPLDQLLTPPGTIGLVLTAAMRGRLFNVAERVRYGRELIAEVTATPAWDAADDHLRTQVARALRSDIARWARRREEPIDALVAARAGQRWIALDHLDSLLDDMERRCGGGGLPPLGERLVNAGVQRLVLFESHHLHAAHDIWLRAAPLGVRVVLARDPGYGHRTPSSDPLPEHRLEAPLQISKAVRSLLAASTARCGDTPPPSAGGPQGVVSVHRIDGVDRQDMGWLTASALAAAGVSARTQHLAPIALPASVAERGVLVVVPTAAEESVMRRDLERHLDERVVLLRSGHDDPVVDRCRELLEAVASGDQRPFAQALMRRVRSLAPGQTTAVEKLLAEHRGRRLQDWCDNCARDLGVSKALKPFAGPLRSVARSLGEAPGVLIPALAGLVDLEARHRPRNGASEAPVLTPTVQRACAAATITDALDVLLAAGWSPSRPVEYITGQPRIVVAAANRIGATTADVVIVTRAATRGFTGSDGRRADRSDEAQRALYACLASAREQIHVIHRGHNDLMPWAEAINGAVVQHHDLQGWRPGDEG